MLTKKANVMSGDRTPMFSWPVANGQTWDAENKRHVYPKSRALGCANTGPQLSDIEKRVKAVLDTIDYGCGNVYRMVAEDLAAPAAEEELALLSGLDYCSPEYAIDISEECKAMLREKLERYQRQHAHNLAVEGTVDILFKWQCSVESPQPLRLVPEQEYSFVDIAHKCRYKYVDWNLEHAHEKELDYPTKCSPGECRKPRQKDGIISALPKIAQGGFYACVIDELVPFLEDLSEAWTSSVDLIVVPKLMTQEEQDEMRAYQVAREQADEAFKLNKALVKLQMERWAKEDEQRALTIKPAFPHRILVERTMHALGI